MAKKTPEEAIKQIDKYVKALRREVIDETYELIMEEDSDNDVEQWMGYLTSATNAYRKAKCRLIYMDELKQEIKEEKPEFADQLATYYSRLNHLISALDHSINCIHRILETLQKT